MSFVHLHTHSYYSLLQSPTSPARIAKTIKEQGGKAVALTDNGVMYGMIEFYKACKKEGIHPILGEEMFIAPRSLYKKETKSDGRPYSLVLLAENNEGYKNLTQLTTLAHLHGMYYKPRIDLEVLKQHKTGLIALSSGMNGEIAQAILQGFPDNEVQNIIEKYLQIFGKDHFFLELSYHPEISGQLDLNEALEDWGKKLGIQTVVAQNTYYATPDEAEAQDVLSCIGMNRQIDDERQTLVFEDYSLTPPEEIISAFAHNEEAIKNTEKIAHRCQVSFELGKYHIPEFFPPKDHEAKNPLEYFRFLCIQGLEKRYPQFLEHRQKIQHTNFLNSTVDNTDVFSKEAFEKISGDVFLGENIAKRFEFEFMVIKEMGFESYFLIVWDYIAWAKKQGIFVGPGRGSGAGSIIAYALSITNLEPLKFDLLFERFLNPDRISMPDFDIDFQDNRRGEVIQYVKEKYGEDHVAQISTFGTLAARAAVKDTGRVFGFPFQEMNEFVKFISDKPGTTLQESLEENGELKTLLDSDEKLKKVWDIALKLEGCVRHVSVHACAVVISKDPLDCYTALQNPPKDTNTVISQFSSGPLEDLGLLKMDFLGLKNLSILDTALSLIYKNTGRKIEIDEIPLDDTKTYEEVFQKAQTTGVFQFESPGIRRYLKDLKPTVFDDIIAMAALYRPGPLNSGMTDSFVKRKNGLEPISYLHPSMESSLKDTYGVVVYQEQIMKLSKVMAGFTGGQADTLRKAMGKKIKELMDTMKEQFIEGCLKNTISQDIAEKVWHGWEEFAKYGFNKSHSACYAFIAYQTAYLKAHYPTEFMASLLTADQENAEKVALEIEECKQMGISVLPPSVNESFHDFTVIKSKHIRFGLTAIKNLGESGVNAILEARGKENIPFASLEDFLVRTEVSQINKKNLEALVFSGALDAFASRGDIASHIEECIAFAKEQSEKTISGQMGLFGDELNTLSFYRPNNFSFSEILQLEKEYLGLFVSSHPLSGLQEYAKERFFCLENIQADDEGSEKKVIGIIEGLRMMRTKSDDKMAFFVLQTPSGKIPVAVFPRVFAESSKTLFDDAFVIVTGKLEVRNSEYQIRAEKIFSKNLEAFRLEAEKSGKISHDISVNTHIPSVKESPKKPQIFSLPIPKTIQREVLESLKTLLLKNPGNDEVVLVFSSGEKMKLPQKVALSRVLKTHLLQMVKE